jgi:hypothetical protein
MFSALLNRAQATVDNAIGQVVNRAIIAIPFVLAAAFATAALAFRLVREFGPETANLMLAAVFLAVGLVVAIVFRERPLSDPAASDALPEALQETDSTTPEKSQMSEPDRELLMAALTSAAPIALPAVIRILMRNLPIVLAILAALFVMTRTSAAAPEPEPVAQ